MQQHSLVVISCKHRVCSMRHTVWSTRVCFPFTKENFRLHLNSRKCGGGALMATSRPVVIVFFSTLLCSTLAPICAGAPLFTFILNFIQFSLIRFVLFLSARMVIEINDPVWRWRWRQWRRQQRAADSKISRFIHPQKYLCVYG